MKSEIASILSKLEIKVETHEIEGFYSLYQKLTETKQNLKSVEDKKLFDKAVKILIHTTDNTLFPNVLPEHSFGVPSLITDAYNSILDNIATAECSVGIDGTSKLLINNKYQLGVKYEDKVIDIGGCKDIFDILKRTIKSGVILQHYCALWNYAVNVQKSFRFSCVKIDDILSTFLKKPDDGYFRKSTRENFTKSIKSLQNLKIRIPVNVNKNKTEYINVSLLDFNLSSENKDGSVILHFIGSMLGGAEHNKRGRVFPQGLFKFDSRIEATRISFAFRIATRFDQLGQKGITWTRKKCIEYADLSVTDALNKSQASDYLKRTLERLIELKCISSYQWNGDHTDDNATISISSNFVLSLN